MMASRFTCESEVPVGEGRAEMAVGKPCHTWFAVGGSRPEACSCFTTYGPIIFHRLRLNFERTNNTAGSFDYFQLKALI